MNFLNITNKKPVYIGILVVTYAIAAASFGGVDIPGHLKWQWCWVSYILLEIILIVELIRCIKECDDDECKFTCVRQFVVWVLITTLFFVLCIHDATG